MDTEDILLGSSEYADSHGVSKLRFSICKYKIWFFFHWNVMSEQSNAFSVYLTYAQLQNDCH